MQFYTNSHTHYCGVDLHTKTLFICILDNDGKILMHKNIPAKPEPFLKAIAPYRKDLVVGVECMFSWYWLANLCLQKNIAFILGHALYMKCIHGGKTKSDKIDSEKIARLIRGGNFPLAYTYPPELRPVRDLLRRRRNLVRYRSELLAHIKITHHQYNADIIAKNIIKKCHREDLVERFDNPHTRKNVEIDVRLCDLIQKEISQLESYIVRQAKAFDPRTYFRLQTVPGIGQVLALTILYEIGNIERFPTVGSFCSYSRLVKCPKESAGKLYGYGGQKMGNPHLKWAFSEATALLLRESEQAKKYVEKMEKKHGKGKALSILAHKLGRAIYFIIKRKDAFDIKYFFK
jgi:transposase